MTELSVRPEASGDRDGVRDVVELAFARPDEAALVERLRSTGDYVDRLAHVAVIGERIVGHIAYSSVSIEPSGEPALALAPVSVLPEMQSNGIGGRLIEQSLDAARDDGHRYVVVLGHASYYPRFGFVPASRFAVEAPWDVPSEAWMLKILGANGAPPPGVVAYPSAFGG